MNYFQILALIFGIFAMLKPFYMHLIPWDENKFLSKVYSKRRPLWVIIVAILGILLIIFTWYKEYVTDYKYSWIISVLFSLTGIKALILLFDYQKFQAWVSDMLQKDQGLKIKIIDIFAGIFGLVVLLIAYFLL